MACEKYGHLLPLCMDSACLAENEFEALQQHLAVCPECAREAEKYSRLVKHLNHCASVEAPADFCARLMQRLDAEELQRRKVVLFWTPLVAGSVGAAAFLLVLLIFQPLHKNDSTLLEAVHVSHPLGGVSFAAAPAPAAAFSVRAGISSRAEKLAKEVFRSHYQAEGAVREAEPDLAARVAARMLAESADAGEPADNAYLAGGLAQKVAYPQAAPAGAGNSAPAIRPRIAPAYPAAEFAEIPFREITSEWSGEQCGIAKPEYLVVKTSEELQPVWLRAKIRPVVNELLWKKQMLVGIFLGTRPGQGYEIHLTSVSNQQDKILVRYHVRTAETRIPQAAKVSRPYLLVLLPYSELPVTFLEE